MVLPTHPYFLSVPTMLMGYLTGLNKYTSNPVEKSITYSFLGTSTFLMTLRNFAITANDIQLIHQKPIANFGGNIFAATLLTGSYYCMGHLLGQAGNRRSEFESSGFKNLIENKPLQ